MEFRIAEEITKKLRNKIKLLVIFCMMLVICNSLLVILSIIQWKNRQVVLVPMNLSKKAVIGASSVSASYIEQVAISLLSQRLDITPGTVRQNNIMVLSHTDPRFYANFKKTLNEEEKVVLEKDVSSAFYIKSIKVSSRDLTVLVEGTLRRWIGERFIGDSEKTYVMKFNHIGSEILLKSILDLKKTNRQGI